MNNFYKTYSQLTGYTPEKVKEILEIQDKQDTKYSRVKTCKELWDIQQARIEKLESLLREACQLLFFDGLFEHEELERLEKLQDSKTVKELVNRG